MKGWRGDAETLQGEERRWRGGEVMIHKGVERRGVLEI